MFYACIPIDCKTELYFYMPVFSQGVNNYCLVMSVRPGFRPFFAFFVMEKGRKESIIPEKEQCEPVRAIIVLSWEYYIAFRHFSGLQHDVKLYNQVIIDEYEIIRSDRLLTSDQYFIEQDCRNWRHY